MTCRCGKKTVFVRKYEGREYCQTCFCKSIEKKVKKTIREWEMIQPGDTIGVGLSGGKDSLTVLHLIQKITEPMRTVKICAISIDEGIAGYRPKTLRIAQRFCKEKNIPYHTYSFEKELGTSLDTKLQKGKDSCTYCGVARRYLLNKAARELGVTKLCTGHNLDDEAQSVLMNVLRGDMLRASRSDKPRVVDKKFILRIKPLREIPEREVALYALLQDFPVDFSECPYVGGMRFEVRDFLNRLEHKHPGMKFSLTESAHSLSQLQPQVPAIQSCQSCGEPSAGKQCKCCELWKDL